MSFEERNNFEQTGTLSGQENNLLKVGILNKMNELLQAELGKAIEESGVKLGDGFSLCQHLAEYEKSLIQYALDMSNHNQFIASQLLGIKYTTLNSKVKKYEMLNKDELRITV